MKLDSVIVRNFRGYAEAQELVISDLTTVVGKNDAGKSTLLEALAIFFGNDIVKPDVGDVNVSSGISEFEITCTFSDLPGEVVLDTQATTTLADEFLLSDDGRLRVKKTWVCTGVKPKEEVSIECHHPSAENLTDLLTLNNAALKKRLLELIPAESAAEVNKSNNPAMRRALWESCPDLQLELREVPVTKEDSKRIWDKLAPLLPHFALFQSDRASRDSDNEVQDPMKLAIAAALAEPEVESMLASVVEAVQAKATDLATRTHQVLGELDAGLAEGLVPKFKSEPKWASLFGISLEGSDGVPINKRGSGVRRLVLVSFFRAEAQRQMEQGLGRNMIYAIEEPETSQHPRNQKILLDSLQKMANTEGCQVLLTTHSPEIVKKLEFENLLLIAGRQPDDIRNVQASELPYPSLNEVNFSAFDEASFEYHNELYGFIEAEGKLVTFKAGQAMLPYGKLNRDGSTTQQQIVLTEYVRHQIHHPENETNRRFTDQELRQSIEAMRNFIQANP